jgi:hypothetical protein
MQLELFSMCVVSAVNDFGRRQWPEWEGPVTLPPVFVPPPPASQQPFTEEEVKLMKKFLALVKKARELDDAAGLANCEDPAKTKFEEAVVKRLEAIEAYIERMKQAVAP